MLARSLIVLLVVLNLGVALWWLARDDALPAPADTALPTGVARLQLVSEARPVADAAPSPSTAPAPAAADDAEPPESVSAEAPAPPPAPVADAAPAPADEALQCYALGPFTDAGKLAAARGELQSRVARLHVREVPSTVRGDWRVWLPPQADRAAAQALVERIVAAGF